MVDKSIRQQIQEKIKAVEETPEQTPQGNPEGQVSQSVSQPEEAPEVDDASAPEASEEAPLEPTDQSSGEAVEPTPPASVSPAQQSPPPAQEDEWEEGEYEDSSVGVKIPFKARKGEVDQFKNRMMMRSDYDRKRGRWAEFESDFGPAIESGYFRQIAPVIKMIDSDQALSAAVAKLVEQRRNNQPLSYNQPGYEPQAQIQPQYQPPQEQAFSDDPYLQQQLSPVMQQMQAMQQQIHSFTQTQEQQRAQQQQAAASRVQQESEMREIHQSLARYYPNEFSYGRQEDVPKMAHILQYAHNAGYNREVYGYVGRVLEAKRAIDASTPQRVNGQSPIPSAAAQSAAAAEAFEKEASRKARQDVANGTVVNSHQPREPKKPRPARIRDEHGKPLPVHEAVTNIVSRLARTSNQ